MLRPDLKGKIRTLLTQVAVHSGQTIELRLLFFISYRIIVNMGKKSGPVLGHSLMKANAIAKTKKSRRVDQQEGFLHTTDMQDGYDWGRLNLQVLIINV